MGRRLSFTRYLYAIVTASTAAGLGAPAAAQGAPPAAADSARPAALAFEGVTVIDVRSGARRPRQTVVVVGTRIHAVGDSGTVRLPEGARTIKASGTYVIPGLWDMHVHPWGFANTFYPLFVANGVTGVRDMHTPFLDSVLRWREEIAAGRRVGPRVVATGPWLSPPSDTSWNTNHGMRPFGAGRSFVLPVATAADARRAVDSLARAGADFVKVREGLSRSAFFAIAREARRAGLPLVGHLSDSVTPLEASDSGQRSIEHGLACNLAPTTAPSEVRDAFDAAACTRIAERFRRNGTWVSAGDPYNGGCSLLARCADELRYWPDSLQERTDRSTGRGAADLEEMRRDAEAWAREKRSIERWATGHERLVEWARMRRAGIRLLGGTDTAPYGMVRAAVPGFSLHNVLWHLVHQGLTPLEALQTATIEPAVFLNATDSLGTVEPGKLADLVFLDADPLQDVYNTRRIRAVVANGRFFDRGDLDALLADAERAARGSKLTD